MKALLNCLTHALKHSCGILTNFILIFFPSVRPTMNLAAKRTKKQTISLFRIVNCRSSLDWRCFRCCCAAGFSFRRRCVVYAFKLILYFPFGALLNAIHIFSAFFYVVVVVTLLPQFVACIFYANAKHEHIYWKWNVNKFALEPNESICSWVVTPINWPYVQLKLQSSNEY